MGRKNRVKALNAKTIDSQQHLSEAELDEKLAQAQAKLKHWRDGPEPEWIQVRKKGQLQEWLAEASPQIPYEHPREILGQGQKASPEKKKVDIAEEMARIKDYVSCGDPSYISKREEDEARQKKKMLGKKIVTEELEEGDDSDMEEKEERKRPRRKGDTPLHAAAQGGHLESLAFLMSVPEVEVNSESNFDGATALMRACEEGHGHAVKLLVHGRADIAAKAFKGETPLHIALANQQYDVAQILVEWNAPKCGPKCMKCKLGLKVVQRRKKPAALPEQKAPESFDQVVKEEFGHIDIAEEMAKLKAERGGGNVSFGTSRHSSRRN